MTWQTGTSTDYQDMVDILVDIVTNSNVTTLAVNAGGSGYAVGDTFDINGGTTVNSLNATGTVLTEAAGVVTGVLISSGGAYTVNPGTGATTTATSGSGTGLTVDTTITSTNWVAERDTTTSGERELILRGNDGTTNFYVGIMTYTQVAGANTCKNWTLVGATAFNSGLDFDQQSGISPGAVPGSSEGAYIPLQPSGSFANIEYSLSINNRRICGVFKTETATVTNYPSFYLGFHSRFGTSTEWPYPLLVAGSTSQYDLYYGLDNRNNNGITTVIGDSGTTGPMYYRKVDNTWQSVQNFTFNGVSTLTQQNDYVVYPVGVPTINTATADQIVSTSVGINWTDIVPRTFAGVSNPKFLPTEEADTYPLVPATILATDDPIQEVVGELEGVWWISGEPSVSSEDFTDISGVRYRIFQNGANNKVGDFLAIKEE